MQNLNNLSQSAKDLKAREDAARAKNAAVLPQGQTVNDLNGLVTKKQQPGLPVDCANGPEGHRINPQTNPDVRYGKKEK